MDSQYGVAGNQGVGDPRGRGVEEGEPGVNVQSSLVNDLEEKVNCTFMKFLAEQQKEETLGKIAK